MRYINTSIIVLLQLDFYFYSPKSIKKVRVGGVLRIGSGHGKHEPYFFSLRILGTLYSTLHTCIREASILRTKGGFVYVLQVVV